MSPEQKQLIEFAIQDLVGEIVRRERMEPEAAMDILYHSRFFEQLMNPDAGLYRESAEYLYWCFRGNHAGTREWALK